MNISKQLLAKTVLSLSDNNNNEQLLGGDGIMIVIDWLNFYIESKIQHLVVIAEIKDIPPRFECFKLETEFDHFLPNLMKIMAAGSWILLEDKIISGEICNKLRGKYPVVVSRSQVEKHNTNLQNMFDIMTTVWEHVMKQF